MEKIVILIINKGFKILHKNKMGLQLDNLVILEIRKSVNIQLNIFKNQTLFKNRHHLNLFIFILRAFFIYFVLAIL